MYSKFPIRTPIAAAALALAAAAAPAHAVTLVGLTSANELTRFDSAAPGGDMRVAISGLAAGDRLVGIDLRPGDNRIYGVSVSNNLYTVDAMTGLASFVTALSAPVVDPMLGYGIDFNPNADFNGASSLRLVSSAGSNFAINPTTGVVGNTTSDIGPGYTAVAYTNSRPLPDGPTAPSTSLYYIDTATDTLHFAASGFNSPTITTVGALGVDALKANGFDITADGIGYAALNVDGASLASRLYRIDLAIGAATDMGAFNGTLSGLTVAPIPEPGTYALFAAGLAGLGAVVRRRQRRG